MGTTSSRFLQKNIESCIGLGVDENALMALVPGGVMALKNPVQRFDGDVLRSIFNTAQEVSGDNSIGFRCGLNHGNNSYQDMPYTMQFCANLGDSFALSQRFEPLVQQYSDHFLRLRDQDADIVLRTFEDAPEKHRHVMDLALATLALMSLWIKAVHGLDVKALKLRHTDKSYEELYARLFECPIEYGAETDVITFDRRFLDVPLPTANAEVLKLLTARLERDLNALEKPVNDDAQVTAYLESLLGVSPPTIKHVASMMDVSERSLRRRLKACGTSFREVLESVRCERYQVLVQQKELSQVQISGMLGYSEQSAFSRAYRKWYGTSPVKDARAG